MQGKEIGTVDFDEDGHLDLVITNPVNRRTYFLFGDGMGDFLFTLSATVPQARDLVIADVDHDGHPDVLVGGTTTATVLFGNGRRGLSGRQDLSLSPDHTSLASADFDQDGNLDLVTGNGVANTATVFLGDGIGGFASALELDMITRSDRIQAVDFDQDNHIDIAVYSDNGSFRIRRNRTPCTSLAGTVNLARGPATDVLFLNGSSGSNTDRRVSYDPNGPIRLRMERPPSLSAPSTAPFVVYLWLGGLSPQNRQPLPFRIGCAVRGTRLTGSSDVPSPTARPASPTPSSQSRLPFGKGRQSVDFRKKKNAPDSTSLNSPRGPHSDVLRDELFGKAFPGR